MADYTDLIARLEKATAPTRPLFEESYLAAHGKPCWDDGDDGYFFQECLGIGAWESAALTLVPEGWFFSLAHVAPDFLNVGESTFNAEMHGPVSWVVPEPPGYEEPAFDSTAAQARTAALALCIAALKARQAGE